MNTGYFDWLIPLVLLSSLAGVFVATGIHALYDYDKKTAAAAFFSAIVLLTGAALVILWKA